jgi:hypothetical protein
VYDVLNTRTSDTNGTPPCPVADAATGNVTVSANREKGTASMRTPKVRNPIRFIARLMDGSPLVSVDVESVTAKREIVSVRRTGRRGNRAWLDTTG